MKGEDFQFLADLLRRDSGLTVDSGRIDLMESRLRPLAARHGFATTAALIHELKKGDESLSRAISEAVTVHDTKFFRDEAVFAALGDRILPALADARLEEKRLRIWCTAAATGQEPYSLAMVLESVPQLAEFDVDIFATDVREGAIARASDGLYSADEVQRGLPVRLLGEYFRQEAGQWRISESLRARVRFGVFNLLDSFAGLGAFDLILCRNVLIYFDAATKADILARLAQALTADGYLVLGASETPQGLHRAFTPANNLRCILKLKTRFASTLRKAAMG